MKSMMETSLKSLTQSLNKIYEYYTIKINPIPRPPSFDMGFFHIRAKPTNYSKKYE